MNYKKQILSIVASSALLLNIVAPVMASSDVVITGNGAGSDNTANVTTSNTTQINQTNTANITNIVNTTANSGSNTVDKNTGGDTSVKTGDAATQVTVTNTLNSNTATVACCEAAPVNVLISGNGAGSESRSNDPNKVNVTVTNNTPIVQTNEAKVLNKVESSANTGYNEAEKNTGGSVSISTGDAFTKTTTSTTANANVANIGSPLSALTTGTGLSAVISGNGSGSDNDLTLSVTSKPQVWQTNSAYVTNDVEGSANTGKNEAEKNTGGNVSIDKTGDAVAVSDITNKLNFNSASIDCCGVMDLTAKIIGNGANSDNDMHLTFDNSSYADQHNTGHVTNKVEAKASTGYNEAEENTGGDVTVKTGDAGAEVDVLNMLNFNAADINCCATGLLAKIDGNGADSDNTITLNRLNDKLMSQINGAFVDNGGKHGLTASAKTGDNQLNENTGTPSSDPSVKTGDSTTVTNVTNSANMNEAGADPVSLMPDFDFDFQLSWSWLAIFNMFHN
jgi:hypothetical protein